MDLLILNLFFMFDKSIEGVQKVKELIKTASKDGVDKQTIAGKLQRIDERMDELKQQLIKDKQKHDKIVKAKEKQIRKGKQRERILEEKLQQQKMKPKKSEGAHHGKEDFHAHDSKVHSLKHNDSYALERQTRKKRVAQQQLKESQRQLQELKQKMIQKQRENQRLRQQIQVQKLLIQEFNNSKSQQSSQRESCMVYQDEGFQDEANQIQVFKTESQVMDMSQGRVIHCREQQLQPRKMSQDQQTDDQQDQSDQFLSKMISKASETESINVPSIRQINSIQSQTNDIIQQQKRSQYAKDSVQFPADQNQKEQKCKVQSKDEEHTQTGMQKASGSSQKSGKSWFSWQNWFGRSKK